jgi:GNAT superfamily N-acetyltransferase
MGTLSPRHYGVAMDVRPAVASDAAALARVHIAAWRSAYLGVMPDEYLAGLDEARFERGWAMALENPQSTTLVGFSDDGRLNGFASAGAARDEDAPVSGQLIVLNLHPIAFGTGLGTALHSAAVDVLVSEGHAAAYLWVARDNPRARRFYEREGWAADGGTSEDVFGGQPVTEVRYLRDLA